MNKRFFISLFLALAAYGQQTFVAVLPSEGAVLNDYELEVLTDKMREAALKVLPANAFVLLKQDVVVKRLGGMENYIKECKESSCIVDLGKKAQVHYVAQASVGNLGNKIRLKVELYDVRTEGMRGMLNGEAEDVRGLLAVVEKRVPTEVFGKIPGASDLEDIQAEKKLEAEERRREQARLDKERKALEAERRKQAEEQARLDALEAKRLEAEERRREQARLKALEAERRKQAKLKALEAERRKQDEEQARLDALEAERLEAEERRREQARINKAWEAEKRRERVGEQGIIGYQYLYKMPIGVRWSYGWFYNTLSCRFADFAEWSEEDGYEDVHFYLSNPDKIFGDSYNGYLHSGGYTDDAFEWIVGYIWRPFYWLGIFGGGGFRHTDEYRRYDIYRLNYKDEVVYVDTKWVSANELRHDFTYELGLEFDFEGFAAYISIRNFSNAGGGIGFIF